MKHQVDSAYSGEQKSLHGAAGLISVVKKELQDSHSIKVEPSEANFIKEEGFSESESTKVEPKWE